MLLSVLSSNACAILPFVPYLLALGLCVHLARNYFHNGLSKYPGPTLAHFTNLWRFWDVYKRRPDITQRALHQKHGDVVRLGPNVLSFADPQAVKDIYGLNKGFIKSDFYLPQQSVVHGHRMASLFSMTDNKAHAAFRRHVSHAFSMSSIVDYEPAVDRITQLFLQRTEDVYAGGAACNATRWMQFYALDVIGEITYSEPPGVLEKNDDVDGTIRCLEKMFLYVAPVGQIPFLDLLLQKNPIYLKLSQLGLFDLTTPMARFSRRQITKRVPTFFTSSTPKPPPPSPPDLLSRFFATHFSSPSSFPPPLLHAMSTSMALAGSDTTAISLSACLYYLLRTPSALAALRAELASFPFAHAQLVSFAEAQRLPYLGAVIAETFRMHPAAGLPLERIVPAPGLTIAGRYVPGGTIVGVSAWVLHRNKSVFGEDADTFRPERWLAADAPGVDVEAEKARIRRMQGMLLHFGAGSRTCIGKNISLLEINKLIPALLRNFEISLANPKKEWKLVNAWFVKPSNFDIVLTPKEKA
ncbi:hypothetical protein TD95_000859 [Thielaviopsis punctulata]|uniref:Cytochrome P450 n=1 Tax=Thielaviopsis punctulata TaxID=72032 RepID=A0A0F4ZJC1_9PEZI|nr:hypothetical protein TD95_000859 [Thielaviopsis punctulata]